MNDSLLYTLIFSLLGCVGAVVGASILLVYPNVHDRIKTKLLAYAVGTLLGGSFLGLLPKAIEQLDARTVLMTTLIGIIAFFSIEKILRFPHFHVHSDECKHPSPPGVLILIGDAIHNFVDGVVIAAAFSVSIPLGIATSIAVIAHEIPQELGDFVILLQSGWQRRKAFWLNFMVALATLPGAILTYCMLKPIQSVTPYLLAVSAASFLYIATTDLVPILHHETSIKRSTCQFAFMVLGVVTILFIHRLIH